MPADAGPALLWAGLNANVIGFLLAPRILLIVFGVQHLGPLVERWFCSAQSNHPQNLYRLTIS